MNARTANIAFVDTGSISEKVARLRAELQKIGAENRKYFQTKHHREVEMVQHRHRQDRILEIKSELEAMLKRKTA